MLTLESESKNNLETKRPNEFIENIKKQFLLQYIIVKETIVNKIKTSNSDDKNRVSNFHLQKHLLLTLLNKYIPRNLILDFRRIWQYIEGIPSQRSDFHSILDDAFQNQKFESEFQHLTGLKLIFTIRGIGYRIETPKVFYGPLLQMLHKMPNLSKLLICNLDHFFPQRSLVTLMKALEFLSVANPHKMKSLDFEFRYSDLGSQGFCHLMVLTSKLKSLKHFRMSVTNDYLNHSKIVKNIGNQVYPNWANSLESLHLEFNEIGHSQGIQRVLQSIGALQNLRELTLDLQECNMYKDTLKLMKREFSQLEHLHTLKLILLQAHMIQNDGYKFLGEMLVNLNSMSLKHFYFTFYDECFNQYQASLLTSYLKQLKNLKSYSFTNCKNQLDEILLVFVEVIYHLPQLESLALKLKNENPAYNKALITSLNRSLQKLAPNLKVLFLNITGMAVKEEIEVENEEENEVRNIVNEEDEVEMEQDKLFAKPIIKQKDQVFTKLLMQISQLPLLQDLTLVTAECDISEWKLKNQLLPQLMKISPSLTSFYWDFSNNENVICSQNTIFELVNTLASMKNLQILQLGLANCMIQNKIAVQLVKSLQTNLTKLKALDLILMGNDLKYNTIIDIISILPQFQSLIYIDLSIDYNLQIIKDPTYITKNQQICNYFNDVLKEKNVFENN